MLDQGIKDQVKGVFQLLDGGYTFDVRYNPNRSDAQELIRHQRCGRLFSPTLGDVHRGCRPRRS